MDNLEEPSPSDEKCTARKLFPISEDNMYGTIPLIGLVASCFTAGILMQLISNSLGYMSWSGVWFFIGFSVFAALQLPYGFHAKNQKLLLLWIMFKGLEILGTIGGLVSIFSGPHESAMTATCTVNLIILLVLAYTGYKKYRQMKMNKEDVLENFPPLESKIDL